MDRSAEKVALSTPPTPRHPSRHLLGIGVIRGVGGGGVVGICEQLVLFFLAVPLPCCRTAKRKVVLLDPCTDVTDPNLDGSATCSCYMPLPARSVNVLSTTLGRKPEKHTVARPPLCNCYTPFIGNMTVVKGLNGEERKIRGKHEDCTTKCRRR